LYSSSFKGSVEVVKLDSGRGEGKTGRSEMKKGSDKITAISTK
jgi:hypothetical protein